LKRVLIVEDEKNLRLLIEEELTESGFEVKSTGTAEEALEILSTNNSFDLMTIDIEMKGMNGLELAGVVRKRFPNMKIVLLTAYTHYKHDLSSWAADAYVVKSPDFSELKKVIESLLREDLD
jgi:DNA-binding response OmpR family regulator